MRLRSPLALAVLAAAFAAAPARAQVCEGDVSLFTQAQVNAFDCQEVTGTLTVRGSDITSLSPLSELTSVGSTLSLFLNPVLTSLDGLDALTSVGGALSLNTNSALTSLDGLRALTSVGGSLSIAGSPLLTSLDGLRALTSVGSIDIVSNAALTSLDGLNAITSVDGGIDIVGNAALTSLDGLNALTSVDGGRFLIDRNAALTSLDGLGALTSVGGFGLFVNNNASLASIDALGALTSISGLLSIQSNPALIDCSCGLAGLVNEERTRFTGVGDEVTIRFNAPPPVGMCTSPQVVLDTPCERAPAAPVACTVAAPLSFDADGSSDEGMEVDTGDYSFLPSGAFMGATGEFAAVRHEGAENDAAVDLAACSFVSFDPFAETVLAAVPADGTLAPDAVYTFATAGGDAALPAGSLFDAPGAFALVETGDTAPQPGDPVASVFGRVVAAVVYGRDGDVFGSMRGGLAPDLAVAQRAAFAEAMARAFGQATPTEGGAAAGGAVDLAVTAWPNPSSGRATVAFGLAAGGPARVAVYDALGREVAVVADRAFGPGRHEAALPTALPAGVYVVRVATEGGVRTTRLTVAR